MPNHYDQLLQASIEHLENLKAQGARFLTVENETLIALRQPKTQFISAPKKIESPPAKKLFSLEETTRELVPALRPLILSAPFADHAAKEAARNELRERAMVCVRCPHLAATRKNVVFGLGDINAPLMFVGEAPGAEEDEQGEPFVGKAGQLLTRIIQTMGYARETVYIANILKCRPDTPGQSAGNRKPTTDEMKTCLPYLLEQIKLVQPKVMVALGAVALEGLFGKTAGISRLRGQFQTFQNIPVMPTYHPAYLLRNQALSEKRKVWEDMLQVLEKLGAPISEKQRQFFTK
ncbi:MAG: uracil-DNA glycosylase [Limisphaerales bacterium]